MTFQAMPTRLACCLAASLLAHAGALLFWGRPAPARLELSAPRIKLYLHTPEHSPAPQAKHEQTANSGHRPVFVAGRPVAVTAPASEHAPTIAVPPQAKITGHDLVEQAKNSLASESRQRMLDPMFIPASKASPQASPLARAMARPVSGEKMLGNDVLQLTTADGKVHCLQRPSEVASRDIPGGAFAIPVTCPF